MIVFFFTTYTFKKSQLKTVHIKIDVFFKNFKFIQVHFFSSDIMDQQLTIVDPDFVEEGLCVDKREDHPYSRG